MNASDLIAVLALGVAIVSLIHSMISARKTSRLALAQKRTELLNELTDTRILIHQAFNKACAEAEEVRTSHPDATLDLSEKKERFSELEKLIDSCVKVVQNYETNQDPVILEKTLARIYEIKAKVKQR